MKTFFFKKITAMESKVIFGLLLMLGLSNSILAQTKLNQLSVKGLNVSDTVLDVSNAAASGNSVLARFFQPNIQGGSTSYLLFGKDKLDKNSAFIAFKNLNPAWQNGNALSLGFPIGNAGDRFRDYLTITPEGKLDFRSAGLDLASSFYYNEPNPDNYFHDSYSHTLRVGTHYSGYFEGYLKIKYTQYHQPNNTGTLGHKRAAEMGLTEHPLFLRYQGRPLGDEGFSYTNSSVYYLRLGNLDTPLRTLHINTNNDVANTGIVSIGHTSPDASALLDLNFQGTGSDIGKGLLLPRYTTANLISTNFYQPATGLLAFDQTLNRVVMNAGIPTSRNWKPMVVGTSSASSIESGTATFSGANFTVNNSNVTANSLIILTVQNGVMATYVVTNKTSGSFTINSSDSAASKVIGYLIIN